MTHTHKIVRRARTIDIAGREGARLRVQNLWWSLSSFYMCLRVECPFSTSMLYSCLPLLMMYAGWINFVLVLVFGTKWIRGRIVGLWFCTHNILFHSLANEHQWKEKLNLGPLSLAPALWLCCPKTVKFQWRSETKYHQSSLSPISLSCCFSHGYKIQTHARTHKDFWQLVTIFKSLICIFTTHI